MIQDELHSLLNDYWAWLRDETELRTVANGEYVEITAPFLDRHNDYLQIYARRHNSGWELTDDGYTLHDLEASGCDFSTKKREQLLNLTLKRLGVKRDGYALVVHADENFAQKKHDLVQAMLAVGDLFHTATATVIGLFLEEVASWLQEHDVRYIESVKFGGTSGYDHHFDFVIPGHGDVPERVLQAISRPDLKSGEFLEASERIEDGNYPVYGGNGIMGYTSRSTVPKGTIVVGRVGAYCGNIHMTVADAWVTDNAIVINSLADEMHPAFLMNVLRSAGLNRFAEQSAQPRISQSTLLNLKIPIPPRSEQDEIVDSLGAISASIRNEEASLKEFKRLKKGLMQDLLTGRVCTAGKNIDVLDEVQAHG